MASSGQLEAHSSRSRALQGDTTAGKGLPMKVVWLRCRLAPLDFVTSTIHTLRASRSPPPMHTFLFRSSSFLDPCCSLTRACRHAAGSGQKTREMTAVHFPIRWGRSGKEVAGWWYLYSKGPHQRLVRRFLIVLLHVESLPEQGGWLV